MEDQGEGGAPFHQTKGWGWEGGGVEEEGVWGESRRKIGEGEGEGDRIRDKGREWGLGKDKMNKKEKRKE